MENIILGLLLLQARTIYELRKRINAGLNLMYSCSMGSIQAAIKKLLKSGCIVFDEKIENGKVKKLYSITLEGKRQFDLWVNSSIDIGNAKNPELSKIYFMGLAEKETRIKLIEKHIDDLKIVYSDLEKICSEGDVLSNEMQENEIFYFQLQTAKYGRDLMKFNIEWYKKLLKNIKEQVK